MIAALFHFEPTDRNIWSGTKADMAKWHDCAKGFGCDTLLWVDMDGRGLRPAHDDEMIQTGYPTLKDALDSYPEAIPVYLVPKDGTSLHDFEHPSGDVIYIVGPDNGGLKAPDDSLKVTIPSKRELWADHALAVILSSRYK